MTTKNKVALFVVLLLLAGGGAYWYTKQEENKEVKKPQKENSKPIAQEDGIFLSNKDDTTGTVDYLMRYRGRELKGTAGKQTNEKFPEGSFHFIIEQKYHPQAELYEITFKIEELSGILQYQKVISFDT